MASTSSLRRDRCGPVLAEVCGAIGAVSLALAVSLTLTSPVTAQITVSSLDDAQPFNPGVSVDGLASLDAQAWQNTPARHAAQLLNDAPANSPDALVRQMLRTVALSGLVPPTGSGRDAFEAARLSLVQDVTTGAEYERFAARNAGLANDPVRRTNARLAQGDLDGACKIWNQVTQGRGETFWVRMRAACSELRGQYIAADLARDILRERGEPVELVIGDRPKGFWSDVTNLLGDPDGLSAFMLGVAFPDGLQTEPLGTQDPPDLAGSVDPGLITAPPTQPVETSPPVLVLPETINDIDAGDQGYAQAFLMAENGSAEALAYIANEAEEAGLDAHRLIRANRGFLNPADLANADLKRFSEYAVVERDVGLLQALYAAAPPETQERLALASDAIGGGFRKAELGQGIDGRLSADRDSVVEKAQRDLFIALGLGANLSDAARQSLHGEDARALTDASPQLQLDLVRLELAASLEARAEVLLRTATILAENDPLDALSLFRVLRALDAAGLSEPAGQLAAREFLRSL